MILNVRVLNSKGTITACYLLLTQIGVVSRVRFAS